MSTSPEDTLTPKQMAERCSISVDTLRYYERENLLPSVGRTKGGHRQYDSEDVKWVNLLRCLRDTGMSIQQLRTYSAQEAERGTNAPTQLQLLEEHREIVQEKNDTWVEALRVINSKIELHRNNGT